MLKPILGGRYRVMDLVVGAKLDIQIVEVNEVELTYRLESCERVDQDYEEFYRATEDVEFLEVIDEDEARRLNDDRVFSVSSGVVRGVLGRREVEGLTKEDADYLGVDENTVLISITDPNSPALPDGVFGVFRDSISLEFWDVEESFGGYNPISDRQASELRVFIEENRGGSFVVHCEAGQSRSAGIGLAIFLICQHGDDRESFAFSENPIRRHHRYHPNYFVFEKIAGSKGLLP